MNYDYSGFMDFLSVKDMELSYSLGLYYLFFCG